MKLYVAFTPEEMRTDGWEKIKQLTKIALEDDSQVKIYSDTYCTIVEVTPDGTGYEVVNYEEGECVGYWKPDPEIDGINVFTPKDEE